VKTTLYLSFDVRVLFDMLTTHEVTEITPPLDATLRNATSNYESTENKNNNTKLNQKYTLNSAVTLPPIFPCVSFR